MCVCVCVCVCACACVRVPVYLCDYCQYFRLYSTKIVLLERLLLVGERFKNITLGLWKFYA